MKPAKVKNKKDSGTGFFHKTVLLQEAISCLNIKPGEYYIDATLGSGGHTAEILKLGGSVIGLDIDPEALAYAKKHLQSVCPAGHQISMPGQDACVKLIRSNFINLRQEAKSLGISKVAGVLFDLGTSLRQLKAENRGFSFSTDQTLDMRMDPDLKVKAVDLVNGLGKKELKKLFLTYGEERLAGPIAKNITSKRKINPIQSSKQLAEIIEREYQKRRIRGNIHPATKVFQALRIAVNDELNNLKKALPEALKILKGQGRLVVISFHGLEDRIVKQFFKQAETKNKGINIYKKPIQPSLKEKSINPSSRSAKLRCFEKK
jgi:16S rRNA (cytosine1402-N4)-methyltransferase